MKKILTISVLSFLTLFLLFAQNIYALDDYWETVDGYAYYKLPDIYDSSPITINVNSSESIEIFDNAYNNYVVIQEKSIQIKIELNSGYYDLIFIYGDKNYVAASYPNYSNILLTPSPVRKLVDINSIPEFHTLEDLPKTLKSNNVQINDFGTVLFTVVGQDVLVRIIYFQEYILKYTMTADTDLSLFNTIEALYLNADGNTPQIFINNGENRYLADMLGDNPKAFTKHTIWDLKTNDLTVVNDYKAHAFIKQNNEGVLIAYYYTDAFVMDHILTATLTYTSRTHKTNWFGLENVYSEWKRNVFDYTSEDYLSYRNMTSDWQLWIPGWNLIATGIRTNTYYQMPRIDTVNFNNLQSEYNVTLSEVNSHFSTRTPDFENIIDNSNYKLFAFALEEGRSIDLSPVGKVQTEFYHDEVNKDNPDNLKIMQIIYETDGKIYTTVGDDIDLDVIVDDPIKQTEPKDNSNLILLIIVVSVIVLFFVGAFKMKALKNLKTFTNYTLMYFVLLGIGYLLYYLFREGYLNDLLFNDILKWFI